MAFAEDYVDVATRIAEFRDKYPDGRLRPADLAVPYRVETIGDQIFIVVVAAAHRDQDDTLPGIGMAYEQYPGRTPYTRGSELQNAETSAWGRAIVAALQADTKKGVASADEVRNRSAERDLPDGEAAVDPSQRNRLVAQIKEKSEQLGWSKQDVVDDFAARCDGKELLHGTDKELEVYLEWLSKQPSKWETAPAGDPA